MAQHSLKQRIQKDKLLQHSYYCIEEPMQSGGETGHDSGDFNTVVLRTNKTVGGEKSPCPALLSMDDADWHSGTTNKTQNVAQSCF